MESSIAVFLTRRLARELLPTTSQCSMVWCGVMLSDAVQCDAVWRGAAVCGVMCMGGGWQCGVVWLEVVV